MQSEAKLWTAFGLVVLISFAILIYYGTDIYQKAPPRPAAVVNTAGDTLFTEQEIMDGQNVWQSIG